VALFPIKPLIRRSPRSHLIEGVVLMCGDIFCTTIAVIYDNPVGMVVFPTMFVLLAIRFRKNYRAYKNSRRPARSDS
jgi:hypothetical protein